MENPLYNNRKQRRRKWPDEAGKSNSKSSYIKLEYKELEVFVKGWPKFSGIISEWDDLALTNLMSDIRFDEKSKEAIILYDDQKPMNERTEHLTESDLIKISKDSLHLLLSKIEELGIGEMMEKKLELAETNEFNVQEEISNSLPMT